MGLFALLAAIMLLPPGSATAQQSLPVPELLYYKFDGTGSTVTNYASAAPAGTESASLIGSISQGGTGLCAGALVGTGGASTIDYLNTNWAPDLGNTAWTISFWTSNIPSTTNTHYIFGDVNASGFRCFTGGVAGADNWILRGGGGPDVLVSGGASTTESMTSFVYDPSTSRVYAYLNGVRVNEVVVGAYNLTGDGPFKVGAYSGSNSLPPGSLMDEFGLYNRALSEEEILQLYERKTFETVNISTCNNPYTSPSGNYNWTSSGTYNDTIPNSYCGDSIITVNLTITNNTLQINEQPEDSIAAAGDEVSFSVSATDAISYQWQVDTGSGFSNIANNITYSGATTATLTIRDASGDMTNYRYRCVVTGTCGSINSNEALLTVKVNPSIVFGPLMDQVYGDAIFEIAASSNSDGSFTYGSDNTSVALVSFNTTDNKWYVEIKGAGTASITAYQAAGSLYEADSAKTDLTVNKAVLSITADAKSKVFGAADPALTYTATGYQYSDNNSILTGALNRDAGEDAGEYTINQNTLSAGNNYTISYTASKLTINKAPQIITWNQQLTLGCGGATTVQLTASSNSGLPISYSSSNTAVASINGSTLTAQQSGAASITATQEGNNNYLPATAVIRNLTNSVNGLIKHHFRDAIFFVNENNAYVAWQWYKNGNAVSGATSAYYSEPTALTGTYYVVATDNNGNTVRSCPLTLTGSSLVDRKMLVSPNPAQAGNSATVTINYSSNDLQGAVLIVSDMSGNVLQQVVNITPIQRIQLPSNNGLYIITLLRANGLKESVNVVVK